MSKRRSMSVKMKVKMKNRSHRSDIDQLDYLCLDMDTNIVNIRSISLWWHLYVLSNTWSSIHEKVKQHWGRSEKKRCLYKKACDTWFTKYNKQRY